MDTISIHPQPKWKFWAIVSLVLAFSLAFSVTIRVFSFYTLYHYQKVLILGYLMGIFTLLAFRFLHTGMAAISKPKKNWITFFLFVIALALFFLPKYYHMAPIRTVHTLEMRNNSDQDVTVNYIKFSDGEPMDVLTQFPEYEHRGEKLILQPGQSLVYSREMVSGLVISLDSVDGIQSFSVVWDGTQQSVDSAENIVLSLPAWRWGEPSLVYRTAGVVSIFTDVFAMVGVLFCVYWFAGLKDFQISEERQSPIAKALMPYTTAILIGFALTILAVVNQLWITKEVIFSMGLMLLGVLPFNISFFARHRKWVLSLGFLIIALGIFYNIFLYFVPGDQNPLTLGIVADNSFSTLAQKAGDSTYFSMGFYRNLRNADLHIPAERMAALNLHSDRLELMNVGLQVIADAYDDNLDGALANELLENYDWQVWPRETGGVYYLSLDLTSPGDSLYFFASGDIYFLISESFLFETGLIDVSILN